MQFDLKGINKPSRFKKAYKRLDKRFQEETDEAIKDLFKKPIPAGREVKKMRQNREVYEARVTRNFRITFSVSDDGILNMRNVGTHDVLDSNP